MEELIRHFDRFTFNQVFFTVDHLSREGKILLQRQTGCGYLLSSPRALNHRRSHGPEEPDHGMAPETCHMEDADSQSRARSGP